MAFADDINLHAGSTRDMRILLKIAENWSLHYGMRFNPTKCVLLGNTNSTRPLTIYDESLPAEREAIYLGMIYGQEGVNWKVNIHKRVLKAQQVAQSIIKSGMNGTGFTPSAAIRTYKAFVRPVMEYGLQLKVVPKKLRVVMQRCQNFVLRAILSATCTQVGMVCTRY